MDICPTSATRLPIIGFENLTPAQLRRLGSVINPKIRVTLDVVPVLDPAVMAGIQLSADRSTPRGGMGGRA